MPSPCAYVSGLTVVRPWLAHPPSDSCERRPKAAREGCGDTPRAYVEVMHNSFITRGFDWMNGGSWRLRLGNAALARLGFSARLRAPGSTGYMSSIEMRMNLYHLVSQVLAYGVRGDLVEFGTFAGESTVLLATVLQGEGDSRPLHVYDTFRPGWLESDPRSLMEQRFRDRHLPLPQVHAGYFEQTLPEQLPEEIAFVNIDCGFGGDAMEHASTIEHILTHVYPRLSRGAICVLVDYVLPGIDPLAATVNPGVAIGSQRFMANKPEAVSVMHAGEYGQAYFRKL